METFICTLHHANEEIMKKRRDPFLRALACLLLDQYIWKMNVNVCMENNEIIVWVCQHAVFKNLGVYPYPVVPQCYKWSISHPNTTLLTKMLISKHILFAKNNILKYVILIGNCSSTITSLCTVEMQLMEQVEIFESCIKPQISVKTNYSNQTTWQQLHNCKHLLYHKTTNRGFSE